MWSIGPFRSPAPNLCCDAAGPGETLRLRNRVTITGFAARGDAHAGAAREVVFPDGRKLLTGCAYDGGPQ